MKETAIRQFEGDVKVDQLIEWNKKYGFEFPVKNGHIVTVLCYGMEVLEDRQ